MAVESVFICKKLTSYYYLVSIFTIFIFIKVIDLLRSIVLLIDFPVFSHAFLAVYNFLKIFCGEAGAQ